MNINISSLRGFLIGALLILGLSSSASAAVSMEEALDIVGSPIVIVTTGSPPWIAQTSVTHDGVDAAQSSGNSPIMATVDGPGTLTFWWKISSPAGNSLRFRLGNSELFRITGEVDWQQRSVNLPAGTQNFEWQSAIGPEDRAWVDQVQFIPTCPVTLSPTSASASSGSSTGTISVAAAPDCSWVASTANSWISIVSGITTGNGSVTYVVAANPSSSSRSGRIEIGDKSLSIIQAGAPCTFGLSSTSAAAGWQFSSDRIFITAPIGCTWTVSNATPWIFNIQSFLNFTNGGGMTSYTLSNNYSALARTGNVVVAGQNFQITQSAYNTNSIALADALNTPGSPLVWTTGGDVPWVGQRAIAHDGVGAGESGLVRQGGASSLQTVVTGPGTVTFWWKMLNGSLLSFWNFSVNGVEQFQITAQSSWQQRSVTLPAGSHVLEWNFSNNAPAFNKGYVDQVQFVPASETNCAVTISPTERVHDAGTSSARVDVTVPGSCFWAFANTNSWITTILAIGSPGYVDYTVAANPTTSPRTGVMIIGSNTYVVTQLGATNATCTYAVSPTNRTHSSGAASNSITINTSAGCVWSVSNPYSWISFPVTNGSGSALLSYFITANASTSTRSGYISVANKTVLITQTGAPGTNTNSCTITLSPTSRSHDSSSSTGTVTVTTGPSCTWNVSESISWLSIFSVTNGTVTYVITANTNAAVRTGPINIGGQIFTVAQSGNHPLSTTPVIIPNIVVTNIGHIFFGANGPATNGTQSGSLVQDFLIDQDHTSGGGMELPNVSVNWDTNFQFTITVSAPTGMKFQVDAPAGSEVRFDGYLWWESTRGGFSPAGTASVQFAELEGIAPEFSGASPFLSSSHGFFGFSDLEGTPVSNSFAFASITLSASLVPQFTGNGTENYIPHLESALHLSYVTSSTNDPGPFVSIVPGGPLPLIRTITALPGGGVDITIYGQAGRTHTVQCSANTVTWTQIASAVMPQSGSMTVRDVNGSKPSGVTGTSSRFYRVVEVSNVLPTD